MKIWVCFSEVKCTDSFSRNNYLQLSLLRTQWHVIISCRPVIILCVWVDLPRSGEISEPWTVDYVSGLLQQFWAPRTKLQLRLCSGEASSCLMMRQTPYLRFPFPPGKLYTIIFTSSVQQPFPCLHVRVAVYRMATSKVYNPMASHIKPFTMKLTCSTSSYVVPE